MEVLSDVVQKVEEFDHGTKFMFVPTGYNWNEDVNGFYRIGPVCDVSKFNELVKTQRRVTIDNISQIKDAAINVGYIDSIADVILYQIIYGVISFQTHLKNIIPLDGLWIHFITDIDMTIIANGKEIKLCREDIFPVCNEAIGFTEIRFDDKNDIVTCYSLCPSILSKLIYMSRLNMIGRFRFMDGMVEIL